ncbi:MAG: hypothetical protein FWG99_10635 [Treponema sp.]|nr:hypothetical protein [Treponema sp.]
MKKKNQFGKLIFIVGVILVSILIGCGDNGDSSTPSGDPEIVSYFGYAGTVRYTLKITENTTRYAAREGDSYELTRSSDTKKSTGTVSGIGGTLTLQPSTGSASTFTVTVAGANISAMSGTITWDGSGGTDPAPTALTPASENGGTTYTLTTNASPITGGTISLNPDKESYDAGSSVTVTAIPNSNYTFTGWSGAATSTTNPVTIVMDSDKTLTATFTASAPTGGSITIEGLPLTDLGMSLANYYTTLYVFDWSGTSLTSQMQYLTDVAPLGTLPIAEEKSPIRAELILLKNGTNPDDFTRTGTFFVEIGAYNPATDKTERRFKTAIQFTDGVGETINWNEMTWFNDLPIMN